jgi:hypothetical protein
MEISRANAAMIPEPARRLLLHEFGLAPDSLIAVGTEAEVYSLDHARVLKVVGDSSRLRRLETLKGFYESLDETPSGLTLPRILEIKELNGVVGVVETRIPGQPLEVLLPALDHKGLARAEDLYLQSALALGAVRLLRDPEKYLLFDESDGSRVSAQSWPEFYAKLISEKIDRVGDLLKRTVSRFEEKSARLKEALSGEAKTTLSIIHGDFFPGNLLVAPDLSCAYGVVDFGSFTMFGDRLLDLAGAAGFYRMYDPRRSSIRHALLARVEALLLPADVSKLYRYLAAHAVLTCDLYVAESDPRDNGHFQWAVEILEDEGVWKRMG